jgi:hypothetical protein
MLQSSGFRSPEDVVASVFERHNRVLTYTATVLQSGRIIFVSNQMEKAGMHKQIAHLLQGEEILDGGTSDAVYFDKTDEFSINFKYSAYGLGLPKHPADRDRAAQFFGDAFNPLLPLMGQLLGHTPKLAINSFYPQIYG